VEVSCSSQLYPRFTLGIVKSIFPYQVSCSVILAAALRDLFPAAQIRSFQATEKCFYCDVAFPYDFESEMIPLLEERMRGWVLKDLPFRSLDMMPSNAAQFLKHHGNAYAAEAVRYEPDIVPIIQLDNFAGRSPGEPVETTGDIKFFKLIPPQEHGTWIRLIGTAALSKDELKEQIKACKEMGDHLALIEKHRLLTSLAGRGWIWLPPGEALKKNLLETAFQLFSGIDPITTPAITDKDLILCHSAYIKATGRGSCEVLKMALGGEGTELFDPAWGVVDRVFLPGREESVISFLQTITKFLKIFTFDYEVVIVGKTAKILREALKKLDMQATLERGEEPGIEFLISDDLGRMWTGPRISTDEKTGLVQLSLFNSLERFVALLVEKRKGMPLVAGKSPL
jgi:threonyl-tRNA synthetase